ncbi:MAG TPA: hypothetical protein VFX16_09855 [Pseudonocardiaceae bacterium]|nr:hypothetical protein [Pseudonocardiaceae bacterium]
MIVIESRYNGPPNCGNGGYVGGVIAAHVNGTAEITLRRPTPLDVRLAVERHAGGVRMLEGDTVIATAMPTDDDPLAAPDPVSLTDAETAGQRSTLRQRPETHPFPACFGCGPDNDGGLRIMVGPVPGRELSADVWTPDASLADSAGVLPEFVWTALDCSAGLGAIGQEQTSAPYLLGRMTVWRLAPVRAGDRYAVVGWRESGTGRKLFAGSAIYAADGTPVAVARSTWIRLT